MKLPDLIIIRDLKKLLPKDLKTLSIRFSEEHYRYHDYEIIGNDWSGVKLKRLDKQTYHKWK